MALWAGDDLGTEYWLERDGDGPATISPATDKINLAVRNVDSESSSSAPLSSVAAFLVFEGMQQAPFLLTGSQVASAASVCESLLSLWHRAESERKEGCGEDEGPEAVRYRRRALLQEAIRLTVAPKEEAEQTHTQQCRAWLTPRELELCRGVLRRCGVIPFSSQEGARRPILISASTDCGTGTFSCASAAGSSSLCSELGNCALHGIDALMGGGAFEGGECLRLLNAPITHDEAEGGCGVNFNYPNGLIRRLQYRTYREGTPHHEEPTPLVGYTALHAACHFHSPSVVLFLLAIGADPRPKAARRAPLRLLLARRDISAVGSASPLRRMGGLHTNAEDAALFGTDADRLLMAMVRVFSEVFGFDDFSAWPDGGRGPRLSQRLMWLLYDATLSTISELSSHAPRGRDEILKKMIFPAGYCEGPPFVSLHAMAACYDCGMRPTRRGITSAIKAPFTRAFHGNSLSTEDDGLVAALRAAGRAMRREGANAGRGVKRTLGRGEKLPISVLPPSFIVDELSRLVKTQRAVPAPRKARSAAVMAAVASLPCCPAMMAEFSSTRNLLLEFLFRDGFAERKWDTVTVEHKGSTALRFLRKSSLGALSTPQLMAVIDTLAAVFGGAYCDFICNLKLNNPMFSHPPVLLRVLWRAGYIVPVYPRGEAEARRACDGYRVSAALDGTASHADPIEVILWRAKHRSWRIVRPLPFSLIDAWGAAPVGDFMLSRREKLRPLCCLRAPFSIVNELARQVAAARLVAEVGGGGEATGTRVTHASEVEILSAMGFLEDALSLYTLLCSMEVPRQLPLRPMPRAGAKRLRCSSDDPGGEGLTDHGYSRAASLSISLLVPHFRGWPLIVLKHLIDEGVPFGTDSEIVEILVQRLFSATDRRTERDTRRCLEMLDDAGLIDAPRTLQAMRAAHAARFAGVSRLHSPITPLPSIASFESTLLMMISCVGGETPAIGRFLRPELPDVDESSESSAEESEGEEEFELREQANLCVIDYSSSDSSNSFSFSRF